MVTTFERTNGIFVGKTLVGDGQKKDGSWYRKWKFQFKPSENTDKTFSMTFFAKSLPPEYKGAELPKQWTPTPEMTESQWYIIDYKVEDGTYQGAPIKYKTLWKATPGKDDSISYTKQPPQQQQVITNQQSSPTAPQVTVRQPAMPAVGDWVTFAGEYDAHMQGKEQFKTWTHMLGAWIVYNKAEEFAQIITNCKAHCPKRG